MRELTPLVPGPLIQRSVKDRYWEGWQWGLVPVCETLAMRAISSTGLVFGEGQVYVQYVQFTTFSARVGIYSCAQYLLTPACVCTPAGNAGSGNPILKRASGSPTCSVDVLFVCL